MNYPQHVAIIPDGNRTRAKENNLFKMKGHLEWFNRMVEIANYVFKETPIKVLTVWGLSTENLTNRETTELHYLFEIYKKIPNKLEKLFKEKKIRFKVVGDITKLPLKLQTYLQKKMDETKNFLNSKTFVLALNYGGRDEIIRGVNSLLKKNKINGKEVEEITVDELTNSMDFADLPNVDLVVRTKGEMAKRLSGFLLWWIGYAQLWFTDKKCPELTVEEFNLSLLWYNQVIHYQNFGK